MVDILGVIVPPSWRQDNIWLLPVVMAIIDFHIRDLPTFRDFLLIYKGEKRFSDFNLSAVAGDLCLFSYSCCCFYLDVVQNRAWRKTRDDRKGWRDTRRGCRMAQAFWRTDALIPGIRGDDDESRERVSTLGEEKREKKSDTEWMAVDPFDYYP